MERWRESGAIPGRIFVDGEYPARVVAEVRERFVPLVLAAPELLAALKALVRITPPGSDDSRCHAGIGARADCNRCSAIDKAEAVIARAEGREP